MKDLQAPQEAFGPSGENTSSWKNENFNKKKSFFLRATRSHNSASYHLPKRARSTPYL